MRWYFGYPILAAGLAFGGHTYLPKDHSLSRAPEPVAAPPAPTVVDSAALDETLPSRLAAFLPGSPHFPAAIATVEDIPPHTSVLDYLARTLTTGLISAETPALHPARAVPAHEAVTAPEWKSAVVLDVRAQPDDIRTAEAGAGARDGRTAPSPRASLTRGIQQELRRVGCYMGEIDGVWGNGSRRGIALFLDRVNAVLPAHEPDVFMLSLLRAEDHAVCGTACPSGQSLTGNGRCLPSTLMAQNGAQNGRTERRTAARVAAAQRVALDPAPDRSFETAVAWEAVEAPRAVRPAPLSGRMSIGGPRPEDVEALPVDSVANTATLEPTSTTDRRLPVAREVVRESSFDRPAPSRGATKAAARERAASRPQPRRISNYRHVQRLFEHPLGRM